MSKFNTKITHKIRQDDKQSMQHTSEKPFTLKNPFNTKLKKPNR